MDPTANLEEQLQLAAEIMNMADDGCVDIDADDVARLAELVQSLHSWIVLGGFLPEPWGKRAVGD